MKKTLDEAIKALGALWDYKGFEQDVERLENEAKKAEPFTNKFNTVWRAAESLITNIQKEIDDQKKADKPDGDIRKLYELHRRLRTLVLSLKRRV